MAPARPGTREEGGREGVREEREEGRKEGRKATRVSGAFRFSAALAITCYTATG